MWKAPVLLWVLGSAWLWVPALGAVIGGLEDDIVTPGAAGGMVTPGVEDNIATTVPTGEPSESAGPTQLVPSAESTKNTHIEDGPTPGSSVHIHKESQSPTTPHMATSHSVDKKTSHPSQDKVAEETQITNKSDGLVIVILVGIIAGVLLTIGFIGGTIIVVMRKISGRFSP
uniref:Podoplanin n=1 Tax=Castor canadensis TaxID=51338 RepID=A0A8C0XET1_CASCN|nr:podoplanin [Castor canadensis]